MRASGRGQKGPLVAAARGIECGKELGGFRVGSGVEGTGPRGVSGSGDRSGMLRSSRGAEVKIPDDSPARGQAGQLSLPHAQNAAAGRRRRERWFLQRRQGGSETAPAGLGAENRPGQVSGPREESGIVRIG